MDPWRDYRNYTDWALDAFIKTFPQHSDHALAVAEAERRRKDRAQRREAEENQPSDTGAFLFGKGIRAWTKVAVIVAGAVFGLAALYLAFQFFLRG